MKPSLVLQTVSFDRSDDAPARELGARLYGLLTRPAEDALGHGPGIPVYRAMRPGNVDLGAAERVVIIPVLGKVTHATMRDEVLETLGEWHRHLGSGHVLPVPVSLNWRGEEDELPGKNLLTQLYGEGDRQMRTVDEIIIAVLRLFDSSGRSSRIFISHAKADLAATKNAAEAIRDYVARDSTAKTFFDVNDLAAGEPLGDRIDEALQGGVFVALRSDLYSSRDWCLRELLVAKKNRLPTLTVELLDQGEALSFPYAGNSPTLVWRDDPQAVVSRALVECLRAAHFQAERDRIVASAGLPADTVALGRPPELLDLAQGTVTADGIGVVIHPDPELPPKHRELLALAYPRLKLVTPTTAFRGLSGRDAAIANPFDGKQIGFSISDCSEVDGPLGFAKEHIDDVAVYLARSLIASGAHLAYGGDFRTGGYTNLFSELVFAYRQTAGSKRDILHSYLAAPLKVEDKKDGLPIKAHRLSDELCSEAALSPAPPAGGTPFPPAYYFSDMRRVMTDHILCRVLLGGQTQPKLDEGAKSGYGGLYPGVVEEAWWSLKHGKPLYVLGGFRGAAGIVADLMEGRETPADLREETWQGQGTWHERVEKLAAAFPQDLREHGLPTTMREMADSIRDLAAGRLRDEAASLAWNGLDLEENAELRRTRDPLRIATLVFTGLRRLCREESEGKLQIELVEGTVTGAQGLQMIAVTAFEGMPLGGAGAALDHLAVGRASAAHERGEDLLGMNASAIDADYLYLASLGRPSEALEIPERIRRASQKTAECALRHGFSRVGVTTYGGAIMNDLGAAAGAMVDGLRAISDKGAVVWFENDPVRYGELNQILRADPRVKLTTRRGVGHAAPAPPEVRERLVLVVTLENGTLSTMAIPPSGTGVAATHAALFDHEAMRSLSKGPRGGNVPDHEELAVRGRALSKALLGEHANDLIARCAGAKVMLIHDVASSQLPFEILLAESGDQFIRPAIECGVNRRLAVPGLSIHQLFAAPPHTGSLKVLVVIDPTEDLEGAKSEGEAVLAKLGGLAGLTPVPLLGPAATKKAFLAAIADADVLHFCGHAFFGGPGAEESGLILADGELYFGDLAGARSALRVVFANACESVRVRGVPETESAAASFAEYLLRTGIEAFLGTYWKVGDMAAAAFAASVYGALAQGETLDDAVKAGRRSLFEANSPEWANYILYGEGRFQLVRT